MISITLPSLHREQLVSVIENITWTTRRQHEILVVSSFQPFVPPGAHVCWVREHEPRGISAAHSAAFEAATREFVIPWADDHFFNDGWDDELIAEFEERESALMSGPYPSDIFSLGARFVAPHDNVETIFGRYYPCFPLMRRHIVKEIGGWLSGDFKVGFSDPDLGMRVWSNGGRCEWSTARPLRPSSYNVRYPGDGFGIKFEIDAALLIDRWSDYVRGEGWYLFPGSTSDFNVGVDLKVNASLLDETGRSICRTSAAEFRRLYGNSV